MLEFDGLRKSFGDVRVLEGVGFTDTETSYARLPARAKGVVPGPVWELSKNTAGIAVRFVPLVQQPGPAGHA